MRALSYLLKTFKENLREWKILVLVLVFAPFFVYLTFLYYEGAGNQTAAVAVLNLDTARGEPGAYSNELIAEYGRLRDADGRPLLSLVTAPDLEKGRALVRDGRADVLVRIPPDFSSTFALRLERKAGSVTPLTNYGDPAKAKSVMAASLCDYAAILWAGRLTKAESPLSLGFEPAGTGRKLRDFDLFVPPLLVFSIIMVLFSAAATFVREVEKGTIERLKLSRLGSGELMAAISVNQLVIGAACLALTYAAAASLGYRSDGSLALLLLVGSAACLGIVAISLLLACFIRTMFGLLTVGCLPFFVLMFFSDCFMPLPKIGLLALGSYQVYLNDILPTAVATRAFNKILSYGAGFADIAPELASILLLTLAYFAIGAWLFARRHFRTR
jgi:ABC-2 type transport system permease protein